jgi:hypothetical protein
MDGFLRWPTRRRAGTDDETYQKTGDAHEDRNFLSVDGTYFAYAPIRGGGSGINISKLGAKNAATSARHIDVVFLASAPKGGGVFVVGWYLDAEAFRTLQKRKGHLYLAKARRAKRLLVNARDFRIDNPPRRANVCYADDRPALITRVRKYIDRVSRTSKPRVKARSSADRDLA